MAESHQNETYCSACREEAAGTLALLVAACPVCQKSFCRSNLRVCEGQEAGDAPAHAPLILCCEKCYQADRKLKKPITFCCVETACPSKEYNKTPSGVCGECAGQFGRRCGDHPWEWWCESNKCAETKLETCPTCDKALCPTIRLQSCDQCNLLPSCKRCVRAQGKQRGKGEKAKTGSGGILSTSEVKTEETANIPKNDSKHRKCPYMYLLPGRSCLCGPRTDCWTQMAFRRTSRPAFPRRSGSVIVQILVSATGSLA